MSNIKALALDRLVKQLENLGCQFKIIAEDGTEFGTLEVQPPKRSSPRLDIRGETNYPDLLKDLAVGDAAFVPAGTAPLNKVQSVCCGFMSATYGNGSYMTVQHPDRNGVEVLRLE